MCLSAKCYKSPQFTIWLFDSMLIVNRWIELHVGFQNFMKFFFEIFYEKIILFYKKNYCIYFAV